MFWRPAALRKKAGEKVELQLQVSQQGNQLTLKNPTAYYLTIAYLGRNEKGVLPGFKTVMVAPFSTVNTNTGSYSGSQFYLGYMDDYGALRMTTPQLQRTMPFTSSGGEMSAGKGLLLVICLLFLPLKSAMALNCYFGTSGGAVEKSESDSTVCCTRQCQTR
ncbi:chaperone, PapD family [Escherichia coli]|uniref:Chaperone, PapD family n=1 Tax=Escherichia coli TaxID=562 RepID=A0A377B1N0_ECOLX|nr:chaperone, PapD family [Escherichia coli]